MTINNKRHTYFTIQSHVFVRPLYVSDATGDMHYIFSFMMLLQ